MCMCVCVASHQGGNAGSLVTSKSLLLSGCTFLWFFAPYFCSIIESLYIYRICVTTSFLSIRFLNNIYSKLQRELGFEMEKPEKQGRNKRYNISDHFDKSLSARGGTEINNKKKPRKFTSERKRSQGRARMWIEKNAERERRCAQVLIGAREEKEGKQIAIAQRDL